MSIIIKNAELNNRIKDIFIEDNKITEISNNINTEADHKIDGKDKAVLPGLYNSHTHAAMTLFRGYADDIPLNEWLTQKIWPNEAKLTEKEVYLGTKLACLEMIKSGTIFFNDMYWHLPDSFRAVEEMGLRAALSSVLIDNFDKDKAEEQKARIKREFSRFHNTSERITFALGPHAIYTVSEEYLRWLNDFAEKKNILIHMHLSETEKEVKDCIAKHKIRPVEYLDNIGLLSSNFIACHSVWLNDNEINLLAKNNANLVHNPVSNMKLAVGRTFRYQDIINKGINVTIGTDGCASNNNLDMFEEMKFAALLQKFTCNDSGLMPACTALNLATRNAAKAFNIDGGIIEEGKLADMILIDLKKPELVPHHNLISNLVYSANGSCVDTTICNGKVLMRDRIVEGEDKIIEEAQKLAKEFFYKSVSKKSDVTEHKHLQNLG
ncbi:MAG: amidohydrolase [Nanoarchaeota archaeon]|nr:amidohydrolase [Nanoarchaeota archaeon]